MKKKILVTAIASVLIAPAAFAAEGSDGMTYTSASEGFYGSLRARFDTGNVDGDDAIINNGTTSRVGVRGTLDMGAGLTGFYQWEAKISGGQGAKTAMRLGNVGIRGAFGEVKAGSFTDTMIGVSGHTDVTNSISGNFDLTPGGSYRVDNAIAYTTPDLNGFQANGRVIAGDSANGNSVDDWGINAKYSVQGLTAVAGYRVAVDGLAERKKYDDIVTDFGSDGTRGGTDVDGKYSEVDEKVSVTAKSGDDAKSWGAGLGYGQDNWNIGFWYGETENQQVAVNDVQTGDVLFDASKTDNPHDVNKTAGAADEAVGSVTGGDEDTEIFSIAGNVTVGKVQLMAFTETRGNTGGVKGVDDTVSGVGVQYSFTANSRVWMDYQANDFDSDANKDDKVVIGLRHDF